MEMGSESEFLIRGQHLSGENTRQVALGDLSQLCCSTRERFWQPAAPPGQAAPRVFSLLYLWWWLEGSSPATNSTFSAISTKLAYPL